MSPTPLFSVFNLNDYDERSQYFYLVYDYDEIIGGKI